MQLFNLYNPHLYILIFLSVANSVMLCFVSSKLFQIIQIAGYKIKGYNAWLKDTKIKFFGRLIMLSFLSFISVLVTHALLDGFGGYWTYLGLIFYIYFCVVFIINVFKKPQKIHHLDKHFISILTTRKFFNINRINRPQKIFIVIKFLYKSIQKFSPRFFQRKIRRYILGATIKHRLFMYLCSTWQIQFSYTSAQTFI